MPHRLQSRLIAGRRPTGDADEIFDAHVLACVLAAATAEAADGESDLVSATGLDAPTLEAVIDHWFPFADVEWILGATGCDPKLEPEEEMLRDLLDAHRRPSPARGVGATTVTSWPAAADVGSLLARLIARRAMRPDHLWQDLGLFDRSELNRLLARHFPTLHAGNTSNMKWKKYFYRKLCEAEGFTLCTAPSCAECNDFAACFGAEDGESRMAAARREIDLGAAAIAAE